MISATYFYLYFCREVFQKFRYIPQLLHRRAWNFVFHVPEYRQNLRLCQINDIFEGILEFLYLLVYPNAGFQQVRLDADMQVGNHKYFPVRDERHGIIGQEFYRHTFIFRNQLKNCAENEK